MIGYRLWQVVGWTMLHYLWIGAAMGVVAMLMRQRLRFAAANLRYLIALGSLLLLSLAPVAIAIVVSHNILPATQSTPLPVGAASQPVPTHSEEAPTIAASAPNATVGAVGPPAVTASTHGSEQVLEALNLAAMCLPWLWVFGAPLSFALTTAGLLGAERLRRQSRPLEDARITEMCRQLAASLKISCRVGVAVCDRIAAPILVGILRPMILLPAAALAGWTPQQLEMVLLHELAHVRRYDNLVNLLQRIIEAVLFFQPMVWIISGWVRREREHCCDELVVARTSQPHAYAEMLVSLSERLSQEVGWAKRSAVPPTYPQAVSSMAQRPLVVRIRRILKKEEQTMQVSRKAVGLVLAGVLTLVLVIGGQYCRTSHAEVAQEGTDAGMNSMATAEEILRLLRANDARFDNLELKYLKITKQEIRPNRFNEARFGLDTHKQPKDYWDARVVKWVWSCSLTVRGKNTILASQFEPALSEKDKYVKPVPFQKEGIIDGVRHEITDEQLAEGDPSKRVPNSEKQYRVSKAPPSWGRERQMVVEFPFGVGFGKRIKNIDSVKIRGNVRIITGQIQMWTDDVSQFQIELDEAGLVRKATIDSDVKGHHTQFEVKSSGSVRRGGLILAESGTFKRSGQNEFLVEFKSITTNLSDGQYARLAEFRIEPLMQVDDEVNGIHGTGAKRGDGSVYVNEHHKSRNNSAKDLDTKPKAAASKANDPSGKTSAEMPASEKRPAKEPPQAEMSVEVSGRVVDDETGQPVERFVVQGGCVDKNDPTKIVWGYSETRTSSPNPKGRFNQERIDWGAGGRARIVAAGYLPQPILEKAPAPGLTRINNCVVRLKRGASLRGRVLDHNGKPVEGARVVVVGPVTMTIDNGKIENGATAGNPAVTDADGRFRVTGVGDETPRVIVLAPHLHAWMAPASSKRANGELTIRLPKPATLKVLVDIPGAVQENEKHLVDRYGASRVWPAGKNVQLRLELKSWEMDGWRGAGNFVESREVANPGEVVLEDLTPGLYDFARTKLLFVGAWGHTYYCDRQDVKLLPGETKVLRLVRTRGQRVGGEVRGLPEDISSVFITVRSAKASGDRRNDKEWKLPTYDAMTCPRDGKFLTGMLEPGQYAIIAAGYLPEKHEEYISTGVRPPAFVGRTVVTVHEDGPPPQVVLKLRPRDKSMPARRDKALGPSNKPSSKDRSEVSPDESKLSPGARKILRRSARRPSWSLPTCR